MRQDSRIRYVRQQENTGAARNFGFVLEQARGRYFMWASQDDIWDKNYLLSAVDLLRDKDVKFVFPTFVVESINLKTSKDFNTDIFRFIESQDRKIRVLKFLALHHFSYKCNMAFSLFKTEFLRDAVKKQDMGNDVVLCAVILSLGRGLCLNEVMFRKRYPTFWPGSKERSFFSRVKQQKRFALAKIHTFEKLSFLFPEYLSAIEKIFANYFMIHYVVKY